ncbi:MAG TPA: site-2 protease family protein [Fimbriimonadaceae bacterium]|nr:site-2 protease family protein [Fimbriimonadaceae bacterium]
MNFSRLNSFLDWSVGVGKLFGVPIRLHLTLLFFLWPVLGPMRTDPWHGIEFAALVVVSILIHELGHALMAKRFNLAGLSIMLHGFGGFAVSQGYRTPKQALAITLAGPAMTFVVAGVAYGIGRGIASSATDFEPLYQAILFLSLARLNLLLGFLNLLPCLPFDGGHALAEILWFRHPQFKATRYAAHVGGIVGPVVLVVGLIYGWTLVALFGLLGAVNSLLTAHNTGGIRFGEFFADAKNRRAEVARQQRQRAKTEAYLDDVRAREHTRAERERLRKLFEVKEGDAPE